jgi:hypothetical protein
MECELYRNVFILIYPLILFSLWGDMMVFVILALSCLMAILVQRNISGKEYSKAGTNGPTLYPMMFERWSEKSLLQDTAIHAW